MAKILLASIPAHGHMNPTLPVVAELVRRGHEVIYYTGEELAYKLAGLGCEFRPYPVPVPTLAEISQKLHNMMDASLIMIEMMKSITPHFLKEVEREKPDLILYDSTAAWGYIAGRTYGIPHACIITTFVMDGAVGQIPVSAILRHIGAALPHIPHLIQWKRGMIKAYGKGNVGGITEFGDFNIVFTSREFQPSNKNLDERFHFVGAAINPQTRDGNFPFDRLDARPLVYISLGTVHHVNSDFYQQAFQAFGDYPAQFILSIGKESHIADLGAIPENFIVQNYVPQLEILQRADVFITHGGMNSVHEGMYYAVPEIVIPQQMEQLLNGLQVARQGAGLLLGDKYPYGRVTAAELRHALEQIQADKTYYDHAERIGQSLRAAGGYQQAVQAIEDFLGVPEKPVPVFA